MSPADLRPDPELRELLQRFDAPEADTDAQRRALRQRILADAATVLAARKGAPPAWWELTATWARMLIPLGVATAVAAGAIILRSPRVPPPRATTVVSAQDSLVGVVPRDQTSRHLLDLLVTPSRAPRGPR
jgi:hypothetical protein